MGTYKDIYIVNWLLRNTDKPNGIHWEIKDNGIYFADFNEGTLPVRVWIGGVSSSSGPLVDIRFTSEGSGEVHIQEPRKTILPHLNDSYPTKDEEELAQALKKLLAVVSDQYADRRLREMKNEEAHRQIVFRRLLGDPDE